MNKQIAKICGFDVEKPDWFPHNMAWPDNVCIKDGRPTDIPDFVKNMDLAMPYLKPEYVDKYINALFETLGLKKENNINNNQIWTILNASDMIRAVAFIEAHKPCI